MPSQKKKRIAGKSAATKGLLRGRGGNVKGSSVPGKKRKGTKRNRRKLHLDRNGSGRSKEPKVPALMWGAQESTRNSGCRGKGHGCGSAERTSQKSSRYQKDSKLHLGEFEQ